MILPVKCHVASRNPRVGFVSLGCPKALVDSERILTQEISRRRLAARVGRRMRVLVDAVEADAAVARSEVDAPEIDGVVRIRGAGAPRLPVGEFVDVEVTGSSEYDLEARVA